MSARAATSYDPRVMRFAFALALAVVSCSSEPSHPANAPATAKSARATDDAKRSMENGAKLQSEKSYSEAIVAYEQAYRLGHDPAALFAIAQCNRLSHHPASAYETYERILAAHDTQLTPEQRDNAQKGLAEEGQLTGGIVINVSEADADVEVDGKPWGKPGALKHHRLFAGKPHTLRVVKPGFTTSEQSITVAAGENKTVDVKLVADKGAATNEMSDTEKRSSARAAYEEGLALQDKGQCSEALQRFQTAQRLYDAPTHLLHLAQCQAATGKLLDAQETYETLSRAKLDAQAPDAFVKAKDQATAELPAVKARVPTLKILTTPPAAKLEGLVINVNGAKMPVDLVGVARPMNPGSYSLQATAGTRKASMEIDLKEREAKAVTLKLAP